MFLQMFLQCDFVTVICTPETKFFTSLLMFKKSLFSLYLNVFYTRFYDIQFREIYVFDHVRKFSTEILSFPLHKNMEFSRLDLAEL